MDFFIEIPEDIYDKAKDFDESLGMWFWNMAVMIAPYASGNLRRSITLPSNRAKMINIRYSLMRANYIKFLEEGIGPVKKHTQFIGTKTRLAIVEQLIIYLQTGKKPMFTRTPYVSLRNTKGVFPSEKAFLRSANMGTQTINANVRSKISQIRETTYRKQHNLKITSFGGKKVATNKMRSPKGMGILHSLYLEAKA
jgi:hypothetical protein